MGEMLEEARLGWGVDRRRGIKMDGADDIVDLCRPECKGDE